MDNKWKLTMLAEPVVPPWTHNSHCGVNGAELEEAILRGFAGDNGIAIPAGMSGGFTFEKTFTLKEHGEFFRGALTMAGLRYAGDFYELLQRYGTIKVTITKFEEKARNA